MVSILAIEWTILVEAILLLLTENKVELVLKELLGL